MRDIFTYENGVFISFLFAIFDFINLIVKKNSLLEKNLNKIGCRLSWATLQPKDYVIDHGKSKVFKKIIKSVALFSLYAFNIFLGWISVIFRVLMLIYFYSKRFGMPASIKEHVWRLNNTDMSLDQIIESIMDSNNIKDEHRTQYKSDFMDLLFSNGFIKN